MYNRAFPVGNALFFFAGGVMSLLCLPRGKLAFAQRSGAMKAPVGLLSDRTVLRKQDGGALPRQVTADLPRCSSRQGWPGRMLVPDVRWLHRDRGKCLWTFSFCSNARSFDCLTVAKPGKKIKVPFLSGARARIFSALHLWLVDGLQVPVVMRLFHRSAVLQTVPYMPYAVSESSWSPLSHRHHQAPWGDTSSGNQHPAGFAGRQLPVQNS